ncbi:MAG TPA: L-lactate permease [Motilibacterales bacterium]|nr:L-lactate permease [Motilibacterales bacterium]
MTIAQWIAALMPVLSVAILLVVLRMPASRAMPLALVVTIVLAMTAWGVPVQQISASVIEGLIIAGSVVLIVLGALAFLGVMRASGALALIRLDVLRVTPDSRIQMLFVGWLLVCFIEGAAGFGTPATVAAPLLIALGFPAMAAVCLALMADVSAVTFGAVGTPIIVGLTQGTGRDWANPQDAQAMTDVALQTAAIDVVAGMTIPLLMLWFLTNVFAEEKGRRPFVEMIPLTVVAALSFSVPAYLWTRFLGVEFGGILGAASGMAILFAVVKLGILVPKAPWSVTMGYIDAGELEEMVEQTSAEAEAAHLSTARVWAPYALLTALLLISRVFDPVKETLNSWTLGWQEILGTDISASFEPLYSPGVIFLIVAAFTAWLHHLTMPQVGAAARSTQAAVLGSALVLMAAVPIVRVFLNSGVNSTGLQSMPLELASAAADSIGEGWPLAAPWVGALGSFVSGSATFSHLMFGALQESVADSVGVDSSVVLAQQVGGSNAGNMVCVTNVVTVAAVGGLLGAEGSIIRVTVIPMAVYTVMFAAIGMLLA